MSVQPLQAYRVQDWFDLDGDGTLRLEYPLDPSSVVLDVGGYEGDFAAQIHSRYGCEVHIFEPVLGQYNKIQKRFAGNAKINVHPYGLSGKNEKRQFGVSGDASSAFRIDDEVTEVELRCVSEVICSITMGDVALIKINVEGGEYEIIDALAEHGLLNRFRNIQVQFHDFIPDAQNRLRNARRLLGSTHVPTYMFSFVWENWERIDGQPDAEIRKRLFIATDCLRERLNQRERAIDELHLKAHWIDMAWKAETEALRAEIDKLRPSPGMLEGLLRRFRRPKARR
jgi:FkbM family methyltransferase